MASSTTPKPVSQKPENKIYKIQSIYGKEKSTTTLNDASKRLDAMGFKSLGNLLQPSK